MQTLENWNSSTYVSQPCRMGGCKDIFVNFKRKCFQEQCLGKGFILYTVVLESIYPSTFHVKLFTPAQISYKYYYFNS